MRKVFIFLFVLASLFVGLFGLGGVAGYYSHKTKFSPIYDLAERAEVKLRRELGFDSQTADSVKQIETIFLNLEGTVHTMPGQDYQGGGALTTWGEDLLILHMLGTVFYLDGAEGMVPAAISLPDNGRADYATLAAEKYPGRPTRINALRYNDIEFIEAGSRRGLALSYTFVDVARECYRTRVAWVDVSASDVRSVQISSSDWTLIFETSPCLPFNETRELIVGYMAGGRMAFRAPDKLYLGSGEYHLDGIYRPDAGIQDDNSDYGKTIEIDLNSGQARHISKGHRNLQGVVLDKEGRLWTTEHGMRGGDELNLIREGWNYGWPVEDMGTLYNGVPNPSPSGPGRHNSFPPPIYAWVPSAAVSSLAVVDGFHPAWDGDLLVGSLKAGTLFRARIMEDRLVSLEPILIGQRIRDVMQWGPDRIALWLDSSELVILHPIPRLDPLANLVAGLSAEGMAPDLARDVHGVLTGCSECHSFRGEIHGAGPSLFTIVGRNIAATAFAGYSPALRAQPGTWDVIRLAAYLTDPEEVVPGTYMAPYGLGDAELARALVKGLEWISAQEADVAEAVR